MAIIDDEKDLINIMEKMFKMHGISTVGIAHNSDILIQLKNLEVIPDIIIMDYRMPYLNGIEATRQILDHYPQVKIIFLTADMNVKEEALKAGAIAFFKKPVSMFEMINVINELST